MLNNKIKYYMNLLIAFMMGCVFTILLISVHDTSSGRKQRNAFEFVNHIFSMKLKGDTAYKAYCSDSGFREIQENWPADPESFHLTIDDRHFGSAYEGRVFFDTGDVFSFLISKRDDEQYMLDSFVKLKWPTTGDLGEIGK